MPVERWRLFRGERWSGDQRTSGVSGSWGRLPLPMTRSSTESDEPGTRPTNRASEALSFLRSLHNTTQHDTCASLHNTHSLAQSLYRLRPTSPSHSFARSRPTPNDSRTHSLKHAHSLTRTHTHTRTHAHTHSHSRSWYFSGSIESPVPNVGAIFDVNLVRDGLEYVGARQGHRHGLGGRSQEGRPRLEHPHSTQPVVPSLPDRGHV